MPHAEGYVKPNGTNSYLYVYQYKDNLGNVRLSYADCDGDGVINPATEILEENNYYPFGLKHKGYNEIANSCRSEEAEAYKFLNKEYEDSFALNVTETDFRHYDSALELQIKINRSIIPDYSMAFKMSIQEHKGKLAELIKEESKVEKTVVVEKQQGVRRR